MADEPRLFGNRFAGATGPGDPEERRTRCDCLASGRPFVPFHPERQDTSAAGWLHLLHQIEEAAADGRAHFNPLKAMSPEEQRDVVTLPPSISTLTEVEHLVLYGSNLVRIPPEIAGMRKLAVFEPYTSHRLHWFPYELTRCRNLRNSTVSTRALYGNFKHRPAFPRLRPPQQVDDPPDPGVWGADTLGTCSVCDHSLAGIAVHQVWISLRVATDVLPLLVSACSQACVDALPSGAANHVPTPHTGGPGSGLVDPPGG